MTAPQPAQHQAQTPPQSQLIQDVAALLLVSTAVELLAAVIAKVCKAAGLVVTVPAVALAVTLANRGTKHEPRMVGTSDVARSQRRLEARYRAAYIVNAAVRLTRALAAGKTPREALAGERPFWLAHERARRERMRAAAMVARAASLWGPLLGWHAVLDGHATPECKAADAHNFTVSDPPAIGWPGTLHGGTCRCYPGRPFPYADTVDKATAHLLHGHSDRMVV